MLILPNIGGVIAKPLIIIPAPYDWLYFSQKTKKIDIKNHMPLGTKLSSDFYFYLD